MAFIRKLWRRKVSAIRIARRPEAIIQWATLFQADGELAGRLPCRVEIVPDALILLAPAQDSGAGTG